MHALLRRPPSVIFSRRPPHTLPGAPSHQTTETRLAGMRKQMSMLKEALEAWEEEVDRRLSVNHQSVLLT